MSSKNTKTASQPQPENLEQQPSTIAPEHYVSPGVEVSEETGKKGKKKAGLQFGNQDKDKKYDLSKLNIPDGHVVVRHYSHVDLANGQKMEDPSTNRLQVYDRETFEKMTTQSVKDGKQTASQFEQLGMNVDVLHNPK